VIECMADGMDMVRIVTKRIGLDEVPENLEMLRDDRQECKITCVDFD
jgi:threonine dehydrogenase-like Zn-dependent dehydrogenase